MDNYALIVLKISAPHKPYYCASYTELTSVQCVTTLKQIEARAAEKARSLVLIIDYSRELLIRVRVKRGHNAILHRSGNPDSGDPDTARPETHPSLDTVRIYPCPTTAH